MKYLKGLIFDI